MVWLIAARAIRSFSLAFLAIALPLYLAAAGYGAGQVGLLLGIASLGSMALVVLVGVVSDRHGRRLMLFVLSALFIAGSIVFAFTIAFWVLALAAAIAAIGRGGGAGSGGAFGPFYPAEQALVAESVPHEGRNAAFASISLVGVVAGAGGSAVAAVSGLAHEYLGLSLLDSYRIMFWLAAVCGLALLIVVFRIKEAPRISEGKPGINRTRNNGLSTGSLLARFSLTSGTIGFVYGVLGPFFTFWLYHVYRVGSVQLATLLTAVNLISALAFVPAPSIARRLGSIRAVSITRGLSATFLVAVAFAPSFPAAAASFAAMMIFSSIGSTVRQSYIMGISEPSQRSTVAAMGTLPSQVTGTASPTIAGNLLEAVSSESPVLFAAIMQAVNAVSIQLLFGKFAPPEEAGQQKSR